MAVFLPEGCARHTINFEEHGGAFEFILNSVKDRVLLGKLENNARGGYETLWVKAQVEHINHHVYTDALDVRSVKLLEWACLDDSIKRIATVEFGFNEKKWNKSQKRNMIFPFLDKVVLKIIPLGKHKIEPIQTNAVAGTSFTPINSNTPTTTAVTNRPSVSSTQATSSKGTRFSPIKLEDSDEADEPTAHATSPVLEDSERLRAEYKKQKAYLASLMELTLSLKDDPKGDKLVQERARSLESFREVVLQSEAQIAAISG